MIELWLTLKWESVDFPLISRNKINNTWQSRNHTLSALKQLLHKLNLKMYEDYVIAVNPEQKDRRCITVRFREEGVGLIALITWLANEEIK